MGHVTVAGGCRAKAPSTGILASALPVGSVVKLMEGGAAVEYLVVNQGKPSGSSLYDDSCDGTWLLRKALLENRVWNSSDVNDYEKSTINTWLNGDFLNSLGAIELTAIKQVKIPYRVGRGYGKTISSGANGLSTKVFLLGGYEIGNTTAVNSGFPEDGAKLEYFEAGKTTSAMDKRIAHLNGKADFWWLRSAYCSREGGSIIVWVIDGYGGASGNECNQPRGIRPALILPKTALFDASTLILKGVA